MAKYLNEDGVTYLWQKICDTFSGQAHTHDASYLKLSGGTLTGATAFNNANSADTALKIRRYGTIGEQVAHYVTDTVYYIDYTNDENVSDIQFKLINNDTENGDGTGANTSTVTISGSSSGSNIFATTFTGRLNGNASSASKWSTPRTITLTGSVTGSVSIDGSQNVSLATSLDLENKHLNVGEITVAESVNAQRISAANLITCQNKDVSLVGHTHTFASLESKPTTLSGYGITDAATASHNHDSSYLKLSGGTISTSGTTVLNIKSGTSNMDSILRFTDNDTSEIYEILLRRPASKYGLQCKINNNYYNLIHSGNYNSYAATKDHTHTFASLTSKPTTLEGYGLPDAMRFIQSDASNYVGARFIDTTLATKAANAYIEFWQGAGWFNLKAGKFITNGGTSSQFLKGDGSLDSNTYALLSALNNYLPLSGGTLNGAITATTFNGSLNGTATNASKLSSHSVTDLVYRTIYPANATGILIETDIAASSNKMVNVHIWGNSYAKTTPIDTYIQFYYKNNGEIINCGCTHLGCNLGDVYVFIYKSLVHIWFDVSGTNYPTINAFVGTNEDGDISGTYNHVKSLTKGSKPTSGISREKVITPKVNAFTDSNVASASKLGTSTVGSAYLPIYLNNGTATACTGSSLFSDLSNSGNSLSMTIAGVTKTLGVGYAASAGRANSAAEADGLTTTRYFSCGGAVTSSSAPFNGTQDVAININSVKEAYLSWGGKNISASISPLDAALSSFHSANRLAFANPGGVIVEYSTDGGATWSEYQIADKDKTNLISGVGSYVCIGGPGTENATTKDQLRITLVAQKRTSDGKSDTNNCLDIYTRPRKLLLNVGTSGAKDCKCKVERARGKDPEAFDVQGTYDISGWTAWNSIPIDSAMSTFGGGVNQTDNWWVLRLTFSIGGVHTDSAYDSRLYISDIQLFGDTYWRTQSSLATSGHMYTWGYNKNVEFPAKLTSSGFIKSGSSSSYVLLGNGDHKAESSLSVGSAVRATTAAEADMLKTTCNITIGNTTKAFNGSQSTRQWTLAEIGALENKYVAHKESYQWYIILLCKTGTNTTNEGHTINGTFYTHQKGAQRYQAAYVNIHSADWSVSHNEYYGFTPFGLGRKCRLVTCTYQSVQYLAITFENTPEVNIYFDGSSTNILFTPILYYTENTQTINNSEIYNSIADVSYNKTSIISSSETALTSSNYNSYSPKLDGTGATGTWGISISGNADLLDGYHASNLVKFYLSPMNSGATAGSAKSWFVEVMPAGTGAIVYNVPGSEKTIIAGKSTGAYGHMLQLNYDDNYLRILRYYNGSWKTTDWEKISAGYADVAGKWATPRTITLTGSVTGSVSIDGSANVSLDTTTNHTHSEYLSLSGGTLDGNLTVPKLTAKNKILLGAGGLSATVDPVGIQRYDETGFIGFLKELNLDNSFNGVVLGWDGNYQLSTNSVRIGASTFTYKGNSVLHSGNLGYTSSGLSRAVQKDDNGNLYIVAPSLFEQGISDNYPKNLRWYDKTGELVYDKEIATGNFDTVEIGIPLANGASKGFLRSISEVADVTGYTPCPVVSGTPYYKEDCLYLGSAEIGYTGIMEYGIQYTFNYGTKLPHLEDYTPDSIPRCVVLCFPDRNSNYRFLFWLSAFDDADPYIARFYNSAYETWLTIDTTSRQIILSYGDTWQT